MKYLISFLVIFSVIQSSISGPIHLPFQKSSASLVSNSTTGELILGSNEGLIYTGNVNVGSTNLETTLIFDTGSNIMWIAAD